MTKANDKIKIIKKVKPIVQWTTFDFTTYFYNACSNIYGFDLIERDIDKDGMIMRRLIEYFTVNNMSKRIVKKFLDWAIDKYANQNSFTTPITLGYVSFWRAIYLGKTLEEKKKKEKKKIVIKLNGDITAWKAEMSKYYNKRKRNAKDIKK